MKDANDYSQYEELIGCADAVRRVSEVPRMTCDVAHPEVLALLNILILNMRGLLDDLR